MFEIAATKIPRYFEINEAKYEAAISPIEVGTSGKIKRLVIGEIKDTAPKPLNKIGRAKICAETVSDKIKNPSLITGIWVFKDKKPPKSGERKISPAVAAKES